MSEKLWFSVVIEGIFVKGLGDRLTPALKAEIKKAGIDLDKLQPAYPLEVVHKAFNVVIPRLFPDVPREQALLELGRTSLRGFTETLLGRALLQVLKLIGVRRSLLRMHTSMRSGNNFLETFSTVIGPSCIDLKFSDVSDLPTFYQGILEEGGRLAHAKNLRISTLISDPPMHIYRVEWDE